MAKSRDPLSSLLEASDRINQVSDELTRIISTLETALGRLNIGVPIWLPEPIEKEVDSESGQVYEERLGYDKADDKWGIYLCEDLNGETTASKRLKDANREQKLRAIEHLEPLISELAKKAEEKINRIDSAKEKVEALARKLGIKEKPGTEIPL